MKLALISCLIVVAVAEPPRFRPARFRLQRQELAPTTTESPTEPTTDSAPYPPSGWKPQGQAFSLPAKNAPMDSYGAPAPYPPSGWKPQGQQFTLPKQQTPPATSYGVPDTYGPPDNTYGVPNMDEPTAEPTDNPQAEKLEGQVDIQKSTGTYYVLLENGELQRVEFMTENDMQNMAYTARLRVKERAPLFLVRV